MRQVLFESADLTIIKVEGTRREAVFVTFEPMLPERDPARGGFGERFFAKRGFAAYHVLCRANDWYQYPEMEAALAQVRADLPPGARIVTYGSSMGGYAALRFSGWLGADAVIALAPQASVDPARAGWEKRWGPAKEAPLLWDHLRPRRQATHYVVYDPFNMDRRHVALLRRETRLVPLHSHYSDHHATEHVHESGLLESLILGVALDDFDPRAWQGELWRRRAGISFYRELRRRKCKGPLRRLRYGLLERLLDLRYARRGAPQETSQGLGEPRPAPPAS